MLDNSCVNSQTDVLEEAVSSGSKHTSRSAGCCDLLFTRKLGRKSTPSVSKNNFNAKVVANSSKMIINYESRQETIGVPSLSSENETQENENSLVKMMRNERLDAAAERGNMSQERKMREKDTLLCNSDEHDRVLGASANARENEQLDIDELIGMIDHLQQEEQKIKASVAARRASCQITTGSQMGNVQPNHMKSRKLMAETEIDVDEMIKDINELEEEAKQNSRV